MCWQKYCLDFEVIMITKSTVMEMWISLSRRLDLGQGLKDGMEATREHWQREEAQKPESVRFYEHYNEGKPQARWEGQERQCYHWVWASNAKHTVPPWASTFGHRKSASEAMHVWICPSVMSCWWFSPQSKQIQVFFSPSDFLDSLLWLFSSVCKPMTFHKFACPLIQATISRKSCAD